MPTVPPAPSAASIPPSPFNLSRRRRGAYLPPPSRKEFIEALQAAGKELKRTPSQSEFLGRAGLHSRHIYLYFSTWAQAVKEAGLEPVQRGCRISDAELLEDWARLVRKLKCLPTRGRYDREGSYDRATFARLGGWMRVPGRFQAYARGKKQWKDVLKILAAAGLRTRVYQAPELTGGAETAVYGDPLRFRSLLREPTEEAGVIFLFGMLAEEMGIHVETLRVRFPDCIDKRRVRSGRWVDVRIEFEFESANFKAHGHPAKGCDLIVCWKHNWADCPVQVLELGPMVRELAAQNRPPSTRGMQPPTL